MSVTINLNQPSSHRLPFPGSQPFPCPPQPQLSLQLGNGGMEGSSCCDGKRTEKKKNKGIIGDAIEALFGEDGLLGGLFGKDKEKKCRCSRGRHGHERGAVNININTGQRAGALGF